MYKLYKKISFPLFPAQKIRSDFTEMLESKIEREFRKQIQAIGGKAFKFSSPGNNGVPDRIVLYKGRCYFVELKKPGEDLTPLQKVVHKQFKKLGFEVYKVDSLERISEFIKKVLQHEVHTT